MASRRVPSSCGADSSGGPGRSTFECNTTTDAWSRRSKPTISLASLSPLTRASASAFFAAPSSAASPSRSASAARCLLCALRNLLLASRDLVCDFDNRACSNSKRLSSSRTGQTRAQQNAVMRNNRLNRAGRSLIRQQRARNIAWASGATRLQYRVDWQRRDLGPILARILDHDARRSDRCNLAVSGL